jgi:hypothetical protein
LLRSFFKDLQFFLLGLAVGVWADGKRILMGLAACGKWFFVCSFVAPALGGLWRLPLVAVVTSCCGCLLVVCRLLGLGLSGLSPVLRSSAAGGLA